MSSIKTPPRTANEGYEESIFQTYIELRNLQNGETKYSSVMTIDGDGHPIIAHSITRINDDYYVNWNIHGIDDSIFNHSDIVTDLGVVQLMNRIREHFGYGNIMGGHIYTSQK